MRLRSLLLAFVLVGGFVLVTSRSHWNFGGLMGPVRDASKIWTGPDTAHTAGLSTDEVNNIDIYKSARHATVNITSTVYRRGWFIEIVPSSDSGRGLILSDNGLIRSNIHR